MSGHSRELATRWCSVVVARIGVRSSAMLKRFILLRTVYTFVGLLWVGSIFILALQCENAQSARERLAFLISVYSTAFAGSAILLLAAGRTLLAAFVLGSFVVGGCLGCVSPMGAVLWPVLALCYLLGPGWQEPGPIGAN